MATFWRIYRFDYDEYLELKPLLMYARTPESLANLADTDELESVINALLNEEIEISEARQSIVLARCCRGEPILFSQKFLRLITKLSRDPDLEDGAEKIGEALAGSGSLDIWLEPASELLSLLSPAEVKKLNAEMPALLEGCSRSPRNKNRAPHVGILPTAGSFLGRLFDREASAEEMLALFGEMTDYACSRGEGLVVVSVPA